MRLGFDGFGRFVVNAALRKILALSAFDRTRRQATSRAGQQAERTICTSASDSFAIATSAKQRGSMKNSNGSSQMALRFCRRVRLIPGGRLNLSRSGPSLSIGGRGKWYTIETTVTVTRDGRTAGNVLFWTEHAPAEDLQRDHLPSIGTQKRCPPASRLSL